MDEATELFSLKTAWDKLKHWALIMVSIIGAPAALAMQLVLPARVRAEILALLAPLEAGVRRMLLLEALTLPVTARSVVTPRRKARVTRKETSALSEDSRAWRVSFRVLHTITRKRASQRCWVKPNRTYNAQPIARRLEAVIRVLENPGPYVARLARRIAGDFRIASPYPRTKFPAAEMLVEDIQWQTKKVLDALNSS